MGTRLKKLKQSGVKCDVKIFIGLKGRLTDKLINKLTIYYGSCIIEHKNNLFGNLCGQFIFPRDLQFLNH